MRGYILLAMMTLAYAKSIEPERLSAYGFITNVAIPLGEKIRKAEEAYLKDPVSSRIAGGSLSTLGQFPYQAGVLTTYVDIPGTGVCGGSLISHNKVIYAAHCWFDGLRQGSIVEVVLGSITIFFGGTRLPTSNVVLHPQWNFMHISNDVGIITLPNSVQFSSVISPIALPSGFLLEELFVNEIATASGFGRTHDTDAGAIISITQSLSHVNLTVITNLVCRQFYPFNIIDSNICTSGAGGTSTCGGDSGGPLVLQNNGSSLLIGITSFGSPWGCQTGAPSAFARVSSFVTWINQNL